MVWTPIDLAGSANQSAYQPDILSASGKGRLVKRGDVLFRSTFDEGFEGWRDHFNASNARPALSLTGYPVFSGKHALMLSGIGPSSSGYGLRHDGGATYKNLSRYAEDTYVSFSGYFALGGDQAESASGLQILIDTQAWDNSKRSFFRLRATRNTASTYKWTLVNDTDNTVIIANSSKVFAGANENKFNFEYFRFTVKINSTASATFGEYIELQINNQVFDLKTLGGGSAVYAPQQGTPIDSFAGGLNFGLGVNSAPDQVSYMIVDNIVGTINDTVL